MTAIDLSVLLVGASSQPFVVRITNWYRENQEAVRDLVILFILSLFTFFVLSATELTEAFYEFTRQHEALQLDDVILTLMITFSIYLSIFAFRRWAEASRRLRQSNTDSLTGLFNRQKGWEALEIEITRAKRYRRPLTVTLVDIDHFKSINDTHGHLTGDRVLRAVAKTLRAEFRKIDLIIRWGGEEFMIISPETDRQQAGLAAERVRERIESLPMQDNIHTTASFGVTQFQETDDFNEFFRRADEKLYEAKTSGRNRVVV